MKMNDLQNFIGGKFVAPSTNNYLDNINPATNECLNRIPNSNAKDVALAVNSAKQASVDWQKLTLQERITWLEKIADAMEEKKGEIARLESLDTGKPITLATNVDASRSITNFRFFAQYCQSLEEINFTMEDATNYVVRKPVGVVGLITPWNLPLYLLTWKIAPALVMGNTIVAKPSELTPLTANFFAEILHEIGFPSGVFNLVHGLGPDTGQPILEHPEIKAISFTGGTATGKIVAATASPLFKKISLELGGKNATIICADADIDTAVSGAVKAAFTNSGQVCLCGSRILVDERIYDTFLERFIEKVSKIKIGRPEDSETEYGSVISSQHLEKILSYIQLAKQEGGTIVAGGNRITEIDGQTTNGCFVEPTVITGLSINSRCATEEIFGPVVTIHSFSDDSEAITMANNTDYGLSGSVWTTDENRGKEIASKIDSGVIWVNTWLHRDLRTPFGGVKNSGVGREGGIWSINFFSELSNVCVKHD